MLATIGAAGIIGVGLLAPNVIGTMGKLGMIPSKRQKDSIRDTRDRLLRLGLLSYVDGKLRLTDAGKRKLNFLTAQQNQGNREKENGTAGGVCLFLIFRSGEGRLAICYAGAFLLSVLSAYNTAFGCFHMTVKISRLF